jgi:hypothetical protein
MTFGHTFPQALAALKTIRPGQVVEVGILA